MRQRILILLTAVTLAGTVLPVRAAEPTDDPWRFDVMPLVWFSGINGNATIRGRKTNVDVSFDKIFEHADIGFMLYLEVRKNKFGFFTQPNYLKLTADGSAGPLHGHDDLNLWFVSVGGFYQILELGKEKPLVVDAIAGVRYWNINNRITLKDSGGTINFSGSGTTTLTDPIFGLRMTKYLTTKLSINVQGDVGGFAVSNDSSDLTWQAVGMVGYDFSKRFTLLAGYRALAVEKHEGSGPTRKGADLTLNGAILGLDFKF